MPFFGNNSANKKPHPIDGALLFEFKKRV